LCIRRPHLQDFRNPEVFVVFLMRTLGGLFSPNIDVVIIFVDFALY